MLRSADRRLVVALVACLPLAASVSACSGTAAVSRATVGPVGTTLDATAAQFTLDSVISDHAHLVTTVLTIHNTSADVANYSNLPGISLLSDGSGKTYTPVTNASVFVSECQGTGFYAPLPPAQSVQGCVYFQLPQGAAPAQLELLVRPTLRWQISGAPEPGTGNTGPATTSAHGTGTGTGTGTGIGTGTGTGTGTGPGPATAPATAPRSQVVPIPPSRKGRHPSKHPATHPARHRGEHPKKKK